MEGLTITPDGTTIVGIMQSALNTPGLSGSAGPVPITRIVTINSANRSDVHEYLYPLANPQQTKVAVSEITAVSATTFLIDERDNEPQPNGNKKIYVADISRATDVGPHSPVPGASYQADAGGVLIDGVPIETFVGVSPDVAATDKLRAAGITVAAKAVKLDLGALVRSLSADGDFFGHDKIEGAIRRDGGNTLMIANDSDFGLAGLGFRHPAVSTQAEDVAQRHTAQRRDFDRGHDTTAGHHRIVNRADQGWLTVLTAGSDGAEAR